MDPLVSVAWLADRLHQPNLVVLDATLPPVGVTPVADTHARYLGQHIPGALFFDIEALSDRSTSLPHMLPTPAAFAQSMSALGVSDTDTLVVYEQGAVFSAPRAWWMLRTMSAAKVHVLDGGLEAWTAAGKPTEAGPVQRTPAVFRAALATEAVRDFTQLQTLLASHAQVVDARSAERFQGTAPEPRAGLRSGHMPGACNVPYTALLNEGRFKSCSEIQAVFASRGIDLAKPVTATCGSGVTAAVLALGLERCGATQVSLYDGSWAEYAQSPGAQILTGPED
ncbi:MAG TPA: 3-mercaptopyruvate sulfurtransferase [Acidobacteriaceae bacterium]|nr:3-mercaptopyruvate sulfurtransferase [Acidobacteriaceae bacterium]